jgi:ABC-2 type transport system permease protein
LGVRTWRWRRRSTRHCAIRNAEQRQVGVGGLHPTIPFLQFISGVFIEFGTVPPFMRAFAGLLPLRWFAAGMRRVLPPPAFETTVEPGGSYALDIGVLGLAVWVIVGFIVAARTFRFGRER